MRDFARGQRCGSLISTIASVQECPDLTRASNTTFVCVCFFCCYFGFSGPSAKSRAGKWQVLNLLARR